LQREPLRLKLGRGVETQQQFEFEQALAARFDTAFDPRQIVTGRGGICKSARNRPLR